MTKSSFFLQILLLLSFLEFPQPRRPQHKSPAKVLPFLLLVHHATGDEGGNLGLHSGHVRAERLGECPLAARVRPDVVPPEGLIHVQVGLRQGQVSEKKKKPD